MASQKSADIKKAEHTLVCLSPSPSNAKIIRAAAKMAEALGGAFTALYVKTSFADSMPTEDKNRLQSNIRLAEKLGADIATVYGDDVSYQIAEFARLWGVTEIVIGRSSTKRRHFWSKPTLTEKLTEIVPGIDIHIIPDYAADANYNEKRIMLTRGIIPHTKDLLITVIILTVATLIGMAFLELGITDANIITIYILGVLLTSLFTKGYFYGVLGSVVSVMLFNFFLTEPRFTFHAYDSGYTVTFTIMLVTSIITGTLASKLKDHAKLSARTAFRTKVLFDTSKLLQKASDDTEIAGITASQLSVLLNRDVIAYPESGGKLMRGYVFASSENSDKGVFFSPVEAEAVQWVMENKKRAGATTDVLSGAKCLYLAIRAGEKVYGVVGISINDKPLDSFENSMILSILGEGALAIENRRNAKEKEQAALLAKNEQLRANLLRSISHDLRTPLTSISGNASNLLSNYERLDPETRVQMFTDIYDDSQWLIGLVENLLSVTRIEEGRMNFNMSVQLMDEVIEEALRHISRKSSGHRITVDIRDELMLVKIDPRLIVQVIINLIDNAVKYTPEGCEIKISAEKKDNNVVVSIADNGDGIPDSDKERVFEMFYTGNSSVADSHRSLGLGLPLCKSIIHAHGGEMSLSDNSPSGSVFTFTLPCDEVTINE
ncbi:MAG: DUF4118 domain-containing protein [Clostridia bacterium]|nr:DUF4118 domain-containing protein [Clostridia bacterium]